jgi:hypothetical protein
MGGGLLSLLSKGIKDAYLTGKPHMTFFKIMYRRHTEFSAFDHPIRFKGDPNFEEEHTVKIPTLADLLNNLILIVDIDSPIVRFNPPTFSLIKNILDEYGVNLSSNPYLLEQEVTFDDIFVSDSTVPDAITEKAISSNIVYGKYLDILFAIKNIFATSNNSQQIGRFIAFCADDFILSERQGLPLPPPTTILPSTTEGETTIPTTGLFSLSEESTTTPGTTLPPTTEPERPLYPPDIRGYFLATHLTTDQLLGENMITLTGNSFIKLFPTVLVSALVTVFPREVGRYLELTPENVPTLVQETLLKRGHILISIEYLVGLRNNLITSLRQTIDSLSIDALEEYYRVLNDPSFFGETSLDAIFDHPVEIGLFFFDSITSFVDELDYTNKVNNIIAQGRVKLPTTSFEVNGDPILLNYNRYEQNYNAFYANTYTGPTDILIKDENGVPKKFYMIDTSLNSPSSVITVNPDDRTIVTINHHILDNNPGDPGYSLYYLRKFWDTVVIRKNLGIQLLNLVNNASMLARVFVPIYDVFDPFVLNIPPKLDGDFENNTDVLSELKEFHLYLLSFYDDLLRELSQPGFYILEDIPLSNAEEIFSKILRELMLDTVYLPMTKIGYDFFNRFPLHWSDYDTVLDETTIVPNNYYDQTYDEPNILENRKKISQLTKFITWSYHYEFLFSRSYTTNIISDLSIMSISVPHIHSDPTQPTDFINTHRLLIDLIHTQNDIFTISDTFPYEGDEMIERFDNIPVGIGSNFHDDPIMYPGLETNELDNIEPNSTVYLDGVGTFVNREVEFYSAIGSIVHTNFSASDPIIPYLKNFVTRYYTSRRRPTTSKYTTLFSNELFEVFIQLFYDGLDIEDLSISLRQLTKTISNVICTEILKTLIQYNHRVFQLLRNSHIQDYEFIQPQCKQFLNGGDIERTIDYGNDAGELYLENQYNIINYNKNPLLERARYYCGINIDFRPRMIFALTYTFDPTDSRSTSAVINRLSETTEFYNTELSPLQSFNNQVFNPFTIFLNNRATTIRNNINNLVIGDQFTFSKMPYVNWFDLNGFMIEAQKDYGIVRFGIETGFEYYTNAMLINHTPVAVGWYYGYFMQAIIDQLPQADPTLPINPDDPGLFNLVASSPDLFRNYSSDSIIELLYDDYNNGTSTNYLQFYFTHVSYSAVNTKCPIHKNAVINNNTRNSIWEQFLKDGIIPNQNDLLFTYCPLCFRHRMWKNFHSQMIDQLAIPTASSNVNRIQLDKTYIDKLLGTNVPIDEGDDPGRDKTMFMFRPESIIYDPVTETVYTRIMDFALVRMCSIYKRYEQLVQAYITKSDADYTALINRIKLANWVEYAPSRVDKYVAYLNFLRTDFQTFGINRLKRHTDRLIRIISQTENDTIRSNQLIAILETQKTTFKPVDEYAVNGVMDFIRTDIPILANQVISESDAQGFLYRVYQFYRGNIAVNRYVMDKVISEYNKYFNNTIGPNVLINGKNFEFTNEIYNIFLRTVPSNFINQNNSIDFYRLKHTIEYGIDDFNAPSTKIINDVRHLMIYYDLLVTRFQKRMSLFTPIYRTLDPATYRYEFSQIIFALYATEPLQKIRNYEIYTNVAEVGEAFRPDVSKYYYIDSTTFVQDPNRDYLTGEFLNDFEGFIPENTFHLRTSFTLNQLQNLMRTIGISNANAGNLTNFYILNLSLNQFTEKRQIYTNLYNYSRLTLELTSDPAVYTFDYDFTTDTVNYIDGSINIEIWKRSPTITNILYDQVYDPIANLIPTYNDVATSTPISIILNYLDNPSIVDYFHTNSLRGTYDRAKAMAELLGENVEEYVNKQIYDLYQVYVHYYGTYQKVHRRFYLDKELSNINTEIQSSIQQYDTLNRNLIDNTRFPNITDLLERQLAISAELSNSTPTYIANVDSIRNNLDMKLRIIAADVVNTNNDFGGNFTTLDNEITSIVSQFQSGDLPPEIQLDQNVEFFYSDYFNNIVTNINTSVTNINTFFDLIQSSTIKSQVNDGNDRRIITPQFLFNYEFKGLFENFSSLRFVILFMMMNVIESLINYRDPEIEQVNIGEAFNNFLDFLRNLINTNLATLESLVILDPYFFSTVPFIEEYYTYVLTTIERNIPNVPVVVGDSVYYGSSIYLEIVSILNRNNIPNHSWVRYLGYKLIESVKMVIDGETIDVGDSDLLLMLDKLFVKDEQRRGVDEMIGNVEEMTEINKSFKPARKLYIDLSFLWINRFSQSTINLTNMLYSNLSLTIKFRKIDDLLYMESGGILAKKLKMRAYLQGNYILLGREERKKFATMKNEQLIERFVHNKTIYKINDDLNRNLIDRKNTICHDLKFEDPCKFLLFRFTVRDEKHPTDKIFWDVSGYPSRDSNGMIIAKGRHNPIFSEMMIEFNGRLREGWKDTIYYQILQPLNRNAKPLNPGEAIYAFCLHLRDYQPSGATNLTHIDSVRVNVTLKDDILNLMSTENLEIKWRVWGCTNNVFVTMSGFGALLFYGTHT